MNLNTHLRMPLAGLLAEADACREPALARAAAEVRRAQAEMLAAGKIDARRRLLPEAAELVREIDAILRLVGRHGGPVAEEGARVRAFRRAAGRSVAAWAGVLDVYACAVEAQGAVLAGRGGFQIEAAGRCRELAWRLRVEVGRRNEWTSAAKAARTRRDVWVGALVEALEGGAGPVERSAAAALQGPYAATPPVSACRTRSARSASAASLRTSRRGLSFTEYPSDLDQVRQVRLPRVGLGGPEQGHRPADAVGAGGRIVVGAIEGWAAVHGTSVAQRANQRTRGLLPDQVSTTCVGIGIRGSGGDHVCWRDPEIRWRPRVLATSIRGSGGRPRASGLLHSAPCPARATPAEPVLDDTPPEQRRRYAEHLRRLTPQQRLAIVARLTAEARALALLGLRRRHPGADERELHVRLAALLYGRAAAALLGPVPEDAAAPLDACAVRRL